MLKSFFSRKKTAHSPSEVQTVVVERRGEVDGIVFPAISPALRDMAEPVRQRAVYLQQLEEEGYLTPLPDELLLAWHDLYRLLRTEEHETSVHLLNIPPVSQLKPLLVSEGALSDADFQVMIRGWQREDGSVMSGSLDRVGALVRLDGKEVLLSQEAWELSLAVRELVRNQQTAPGERTNQLGWAKVRKLAKSCGAGMDGFLGQTVVVNPDKLKLALRKSALVGTPVIEIEPIFDGQPADWLQAFDAHDQVQDRYHVVESDGSITHILIAPNVRSVLESVKRMPGRRVAGDSALQLVRNPYSVLGDDAVEVLDEREYEQAREEAAIYFHHFIVHPELDEAGKVVHVDLHLQAITENPPDVSVLKFQAAHEFAAFVKELEVKLAAGFACGFWQGYELELGDFHLKDLQGLQALLARWEQETMGKWFDDVFDLSQYGERVVGIGQIEKPFSPFIGKEGGENWLPDELLQAGGLDADLINKWDTANREHFDTFCERIEEAEATLSNHVILPGLEIQLGLAFAKRLRDAWGKAFYESEQGGGSGDKAARTGLLIEDNIESAKAEVLSGISLPVDAKAELPLSLQDGITLRQHQLYGVAWLQHLFLQSGRALSGCLLADDMGLGKTLQLLTFVAWYLERTEKPEPVLIVAPVSLLDNWEREFERFFRTAQMPVLKLYGSELSAVKLKRQEIPASLQAQGIRNLLRPGWVGSASIVLTTYETLRDQELSLARQQWSIMVCDEAQKIKNPAAMVTQAAKAVPARFRVACTGTPVENSLTDLWCLFDFAQPGLLGALNEFGRTYRRPIECQTDADRLALEALRTLIEPQLLRRTKEEVADLPEKIEDEACRNLPISEMQTRLYLSEIESFQKKGELLKKTGERNIAVLGLLHTLRKICAHPHSIYPVGELFDVSPKMRWLIEKLEYIKKCEEKVIIFTEFRDMQRDLRLTIMDHFSLPNVPIVNGDTSATASRGPNRQGVIDQFQQNPGFGVIILSTSAVGFGVNVQKANHVIHFTRPWNPAKEDQATDRAYRIGQEKNVYVYYPTVSSDCFETFEWKLDKLLSSKREVAHDMLNGAEEVSLMELADAPLSSIGA